MSDQPALFSQVSRLNSRLGSLVYMTEPASDIHMEDGGSAPNDQRYLLDFNKSYAISEYAGYPATDQQMTSFEQLHACHNGSSLAFSTTLPVHPAQSWVPDPYSLEFDNNLLFSNVGKVIPSTWWTQAFSGPAGKGSTRFHEAVSPILLHE